MAVTESKGDGYSLFNGVKLPSLPEYDTATYPYAFIYTDSENNTILVASPEKIIFGNLWAEDEMQWMQDGAAARCAWTLNGDGWGTPIIAEDFMPHQYTSLLWATWNTTFTDWDSNVTDYIAASDPISLDGMNVIEWDGDTTGLELFPNSTVHFLVSGATNADVNRAWVLTRLMTADGSLYVVEGTFTPAAGSFFTMTTFGRYVEVASENYPTTGIYLAKNGSAFHMNLFAYYPTEEEGMSQGEIIMLHQMFPEPIAKALTGKWYWYE